MSCKNFVVLIQTDSLLYQWIGIPMHGFKTKYTTKPVYLLEQILFVNMLIRLHKLVKISDIGMTQ